MSRPPRASALLDPRASVTLDDYVVAAAWSADGGRLAAIGGEGRVFLLDATGVLAARPGRDGKIAAGGAGLIARQVGEHAVGGLTVVASPKGNLFASSGQDNSVVLRDAESGSTRATLRPGRAWSEQLAFAPDGATLAIASGKALSLWSSDGTLVHPFEPHPSTLTAVAWDAAGRELGVATQGGLHFHRRDAGGFVARRYEWAGHCLTLALSPNGRIAASGLADGSVHFWYLGTGRDSQMRGYPGRVAQTSWSGNSRYLATPAANDVVVWDFGGRGPEGSKPIVLRGHTEAIECLAFQPGGAYLVSAGRDWRLSLWSPGRAEVALDAHLTDAEASCLAWSPDGNYVAVGERKGKLTLFALARTG
jgi:WD40 repeat protein